MTRKKFIKTLMGMGVRRNRAREEAERIQKNNHKTALYNRFAAFAEQEIELYTALDGYKHMVPIRRHEMESYREALQQGE